MKSADRKERELHAQLVVRELELEDLPVVFALGERLFTAERWPTLYRTWDEYELVELFASDSDFCFVAELDDKIAGFALGTLIEKRRSAWTYGWLLWIGVDPDVKGHGVGKRLLNRLTETFIENGARIMLVDTEADNFGAIQFFKNQGFSNEIEHVYFSRNLTTHPKYIQKKAVKSNMKAKGELI